MLISSWQAQVKAIKMRLGPNSWRVLADELGPILDGKEHELATRPFKIAVLGRCQAFTQSGEACEQPAIIINSIGYAVCSQHYRAEPMETGE